MGLLDIRLGAFVKVSKEISKDVDDTFIHGENWDMVAAKMRRRQCLPSQMKFKPSR